MVIFFSILSIFLNKSFSTNSLNISALTAASLIPVQGIIIINSSHHHLQIISFILNVILKS